MLDMSNLYTHMISNNIIPNQNLSYKPNSFFRFNIKGDARNKKNGWLFVAQDNNNEYAIYSSWKHTDNHYVYIDNDNGLTKRQRNKIHKQSQQTLNKALIQHAIEQSTLRYKNIKKISSQLKYNINAYNNLPYVQRKKCSNYTQLVVGDALVIPVYSAMLQIQGYQYIYFNQKRFMVGTQIKNNFFELQNVDAKINLAKLKISETKNQKAIICEGYATACTIAKLTNEYRIFICFSSNNIANVCDTICNTYKFKNVIIAADRDRHNKEIHNDIGYKKSQEACKQYHCNLLSISNLSDSNLEDYLNRYKVSDWNDIECLFGLDKAQSLFNQRVKKIEQY